RGRGKSRRADRGAERDAPPASGARAGWRAAWLDRAHERRPAGRAQHLHLHRLSGRAVSVERQGPSGVDVPGRGSGASQHDLDRPANEPLADVVRTAGHREDRRRGRESRRARRLTVTRADRAEPAAATDAPVLPAIVPRVSGQVARIVEVLVPARLGRSFRWLLAASIATNIGDGIAIAAGPLLVASQTRDPFLVSLALLSEYLPHLVFGLFAGVVADRHDRRRIVAG